MDELRGPIILPQVWRLAENPDEVPWQPFRDGIEMYPIYGGGEDAPAAALLRYAPGASVPRHEHTGYEHILVLSGAQEDQHGRYPAGSFVVNPPGSRHAVASESGCIVLVIWHRPVSFL